MHQRVTVIVLCVCVCVCVRVCVCYHIFDKIVHPYITTTRAISFLRYAPDFYKRDFLIVVVYYCS